MHKIKFSRCPIGRHKGERWEKLAKVDTSKPVKLAFVDYMWSDEFWNAGVVCNCGVREGFLVRLDTFADFSRDEWEQLLQHFYNAKRVFGILLSFDQGDEKRNQRVTTFRAYDVRKASYYGRCVGEEFMVVEVE